MCEDYQDPHVMDGEEDEDVDDFEAFVDGCTR